MLEGVVEKSCASHKRALSGERQKPLRPLRERSKISCSFMEWPSYDRLSSHASAKRRNLHGLKVFPVERSGRKIHNIRILARV